MPKQISYDTALRKFAGILNGSLGVQQFDASSLKEAIDALEVSRDKKMYYTDIVKRLRPITFSQISHKQYAVRKPRNATKDNTVQLLGQGAAGKVYQSIITPESSYKEVAINPRGPDQSDEDYAEQVEEEYRTLFLECWIQTVLSCDANYGKNICNITGIYSSPSRANPNIYITLEYINTNLFDFDDYGGLTNCLLRNFIDESPESKINTGQILPIFKELGEVLDYFRENYGFFHRDLHGRNVMFSVQDGMKTLKLIDFGNSCMMFNNVLYSMPSKDLKGMKAPTAFRQDPILTSIGSTTKACAIHDLLMFLLFFYEEVVWPNLATFELRALIYLLLGTNPDTNFVKLALGLKEITTSVSVQPESWPITMWWYAYRNKEFYALLTPSPRNPVSEIFRDAFKNEAITTSKFKRIFSSLENASEFFYKNLRHFLAVNKMSYRMYGINTSKEQNFLLDLPKPTWKNWLTRKSTDPKPVSVGLSAREPARVPVRDPYRDSYRDPKTRKRSHM